MLKVENCKFLEDLKVFDFLDVEPLKVNGLELKYHGYFLLLREGIGHGIVERSLSDKVNTDLILFIEPLVIVLFGLGNLLLFNSLRFDVGMLHGGGVGFHLK
jgi:hypothetical protein